MLSAWLYPIVLVAFAVETALGFGAAVVGLALGTLFMPLEELLPAFVPLNLALSTIIAARNLSHVRWRLLGAPLLPCLALGLPFGLYALSRLDARIMKAAFGVFVLGLSAIELAKVARPHPSAPSSLGRLGSWGLLWLGGVIHGAFATGGPMVVYVMGRKPALGKDAFRATLSALWFVVNVIVVGTYVVLGTVNRASLGVSLELALPVVFGIVLGEWAFRRIPEQRFRVAVFAMLAVAGLAIVAGSVVKA